MRAYSDLRILIQVDRPGLAGCTIPRPWRYRLYGHSNEAIEEETTRYSFDKDAEVPLREWEPMNWFQPDLFSLWQGRAFTREGCLKKARHYAAYFCARNRAALDSPGDPHLYHEEFSCD